MIEQGGEETVQPCEDLDALRRSGLDHVHIAALARTYRQLMQDRLSSGGSSGDTNDVIEQTFVDFERALAARAGDRERIFEVGCVVAEVGGDFVPGLIVLRDHGQGLIPRFQLDENGAARSEVLELNRRLGVESDAWSVACWWVTRQPDLDERTPVELLNDDRIDHLLERLDDPVWSF